MRQVGLKQGMGTGKRELRNNSDDYWNHGCHAGGNRHPLDAFYIQSPKAVEGDIASGDKFFADCADLAKLLLRLPTIAAVDMGSAAVAQVCHEYSVPFTVVRTISDAADESAAHDFPRFLRHVATAYSHGILKRLFTDSAR